MPRIINAYDGNSAIGSSLAKLGESIFGDQAKNEVYRQTAAGKKRENDSIPLLADAAANGNSNEIARQAVMSGLTGQNAADYNRLGVANHASSIDDPRLAISMLGAGGSMASTAPGQSRALANDRSIAGGHDATTLAASEAASKRQADTQLAIDARTLTPVDNGDGTSHYDTKTNAGSGHMAVPVTKEGVLGGMLRKYAAGNAPTNVASLDPNAPAPAPANPFANIPPQVQHVLGVGMPEQSMVHPASGMTGISRDGGQNVILPNGASIPATGFQPVDQGTALNEARGNLQRAQTAQPLAIPNAANSQAAANAERTAGLGPKVGTVLNNELGSIPGMPSVINAFHGSPQIAPGVQGARQDQDILAQQTRAILAGATGRQTTQAQKWVDELLPQGDAFTNPATEGTKVPKIIGALQGDHEQLRQVVQTTADPAERTKALVQMHVLEGLIKKWAAPAPTAGAQPAVAPPQAAPTAGAPAQTGVPMGAVQMLRQNPNLAAYFDAKYGAGASAQALGGR